MDVRRRLAGKPTLCRINNLATNESLQLLYRDERHIERDIGWILRPAAPFEQKPT